MTLRAALAAVLASASLLAPFAAAAAHAPQVSIGSLSQLPTPLPLPYDETANARAVLDRARAEARASRKLLLVDLGGNWCPDCRLLSAVMRLPEVARFVRAHYVVATIDVGRENRNLDIPAHWGVDHLEGVPSILIVDRNDRLLDAGHIAALHDARSMTPQALADWLARWVR